MIEKKQKIDFLFVRYFFYKTGFINLFPFI